MPIIITQSIVTPINITQSIVMPINITQSIVMPINITQTFSTPWTLLPRRGARDIKEEAYQEMCSLLGQWKEEIVIILVF